MVVLVDHLGDPIGVQSKADVHGQSTPRHLAFSCHVVDERGRLLVTRRALTKKTWPGVWTNSFCGHPGPGESLEDAVRRRAGFELGLTVDDITCAIADFGYVARDATGIQENEHCPVFIARAVSDLTPNPAEVAQTQWTSASELRSAIDAAPWAFSPWLVEHFPQLAPHLAGHIVEAGDDD
ncbi:MULTISPECIES: isopentenyl-diphosphate Delta-isomerase [Brevibacterium]|uniref:Isopentenyl-diphosphate Delta-isomerase n=3 Tax=Brevibacterium TaxID=1696 RepID=A0A2H1K4Q8_9MICO|nr:MULTISPECIES: isopentenyl-diphosphate Delta-isomerase [Brevibacterium]AZL10303.1 isopentenyl-diphosphate delta-isomerase [Brevibacterium aurantiacum]AZL13988.1 isopentenyl-diphosphate delta-isomerase [Brevibacterium aurantiacum]SMX82942.1 isopentenyl-diphosphate delta-isomerase [Brevibacterium antiquum]SMX94272.1 isopentenyl-diphosphate delta-isomerase [Brevibacterium antiquum CNRZ 918]HCG55669.1 isopentenyl-diphosphate Delta-isomerase [Brevibacterium sp.]